MRRLFLFVSFTTLAIAGCIQLPTEKQDVVDLRPQLSFKLADPADVAAAYRVFVDGLDMGTADTYESGKTALRVLSGTHLVRVERSGQPVVNERLYLGDSATKTLLLTKP